MLKKLLGILVLSLLVLGFNGIGYASLTDGLVAYYPFNGNANDESGNGNNGIVHGATLTADRFGNANSAYSFDGINDYIAFPETVFGPSVAGCSFSVRIFAGGIDDANSKVIIYKGAINGEVGLSINGEDELDSGVCFAVKLGNGLWYNACTPKIKNSYVHLVGIYRQGEQIEIWVNGVLMNHLSVPFASLHVQKSYSSSIGAYNQASSFWNNIIDDVRIYNRALSKPEVVELFNGSTQETCYQEGYAAGQAACKSNPASCGINVNGGDAVILTPDLKMHLPNIQYNTLFGIMSVWADLAYDATKTDGTYFKVTGAGEN